MKEDIEIWKNVENYEGIYEISNFGRLKSMARISEIGRRLKEKLIKPYLSTNGYYVYYLTKNKHKKSLLVHRILATAFVENKENKPFVNHIDGFKFNNSIDNLEWCTSSENNKHAYDIGIKKGCWINKSGFDNFSSKKVIKMDLNFNKIEAYGSASEASRITGFSQSQISRHCKNETSIYKGYRWKYLP